MKEIVARNIGPFRHASSLLLFPEEVWRAAGTLRNRGARRRFCERVTQTPLVRFVRASETAGDSARRTPSYKRTLELFLHK